MEKEKQEKERREREKQEKKEREKKEREQKEKERREQLEKEKKEREQKEKERREQLEREKKEREQKEKERREQLEREKKERQEKKEKERLEREKEKERKRQESITGFSMRSSDSYKNKKEDLMGTRIISGKKVIEESPSIKNNYKSFIGYSPKEITIGQNNIRKIEISRDISNRGGSARGSSRGRDSDDKTFRYSSIGTDRKREQNTESKIIRSRFDEEDSKNILSQLNKTKGISLRNVNELIENKLVARSYKKPELESGNLFKKSYQFTEKQKKPENKYIKKSYQKDESNTIDSKLNNRTNLIMPNQEIKIREMKKIFQLPESKSIDLSESKWTRSKDHIKTEEKEKKYYLDLPNTQHNLSNIQKKDDSFDINKYLISDSKRISESKDEIRKGQSRTSDKYLRGGIFARKDLIEREREKQERKEKEIKEREEKARIEREKREREKKEREEKARIEREQKEKEKREREEKIRIEKEKKEKEKKEKEERDRKEKERIEKERI